MTRFVWHDGQWLPVGRHVPAPRVHIISDHMAPLRHMATGQIIDSKSAFRAATRAAGCVELGNDAPIATPAPTFNRAELRRDIATAVQQLEQGRPAPRPAEVAGPTRYYE